MRGSRGWRVVVAATAAVLATQIPAGAASLTDGRRLAATYDLILDGRFADAAAALETCAPAPRVACDLLAVTALWWRIQLDPESLALDDRFSAEVDAVIAAGERWTAEEPERAEAWFYLGGAYGARVQWRVLRGERLAAARDGKRIKETLETARVLDPSLTDARFGIGLYRYYADVAPAVAKFLRFLLLLPGGDREAGLRDMIETQDHGSLLRGEARYQLHWIYLWYEERPEEALAILEALSRRYPRNPVFRKRLAEVQLEYFHDRAGALATWLALADAARAGEVARPQLSLALARLGAADQLDARFETDRAIDLLQAVVASGSTEPYAAVSRAALRLGETCDRLGRRDDALAAYRQALASTPPRDVYEIAPRARAGLRRRPDPRRARAYALSLEGLRALEDGALARAAEALDAALAMTGDDPIAWYRRGRVHRARHEPDRALAAFGRVIAARPVAPPVVLAPAYVERAEILEKRGERAGAVDALRTATRVFGADAAVRDRAARALARLHPSITQR